MLYRIKLNAHQEQTVTFAAKGHNLLITGQAGVGISEVVKRMIPEGAWKKDAVEPPVSDHPKFQVLVVAYESLDHNGSKFVSLVYGNYREFPHVLNVLFMGKVNSRGIRYFSIEKFPSLVLLWNVIMLQHFIIQCLLYYLSSGRLREVINKRKFLYLIYKLVVKYCKNSFYLHFKI